MPHKSSNSDLRQTALHKQAKALRKAVKNVLSDPEPDEVHDLRSTTRRIQALIQLALSADQPSDPKEFKREHKAVQRFEKAIKPVRHASGALRDLDIHLKLLDKIARDPKLRLDAERLAHAVEEERVKMAADLQKLLDKYEGKVRKTLDDLETIEAADSVPQPARQARTLFVQAAQTLNPNNDEQLHSLRKAARNSRYIAESVSSTKPSITAKHFHKIHKVTGDWHDLLTLIETARRLLPATSPLIPALEQRLFQAHRVSLKLLAKTGSERLSARLSIK